MLNQYKGDIGHFESYTNENLPAVDDQFTTVTYSQVFEKGVPAEEALDQAQSDLENQLGQ